LALIQLTCEDIKDEFHQSNTISDKALLPHLGQIDKACLKIKKLVDQLRNYSRHDSKEVPENKDIKELIEESLFLVKQKLRTGNIKANVILEEKISQMTLLCYANKLEQVLMNLMSNACDAMKNLTKKELTIKAFMQDNYFLIAVQDTGTGIPDDIKPKIFESFYTTKPKGEGTGLGLSIVKNIVIEHGGDLLVDSEMGKGSTFTIKLPALKLSPLNKTDKIQAA
jgi:signal transduction histidine kinase